MGKHLTQTKDRSFSERSMYLGIPSTIEECIHTIPPTYLATYQKMAGLPKSELTLFRRIIRKIMHDHPHYMTVPDCKSNDIRTWIGFQERNAVTLWLYRLRPMNSYRPEAKSCICNNSIPRTTRDATSTATLGRWFKKIEVHV